MLNTNYYDMLIEIKQFNLKDNKKYIKILLFIFIIMICVLICDLNVSKTFMTGFAAGCMSISILCYIIDISIAIVDRIYIQKEILIYKDMRNQINNIAN
jgi:undecaprenyl pyrophosphate phosphatase UppP